MSTLAYAQLTTTRDVAPPQTSTSTSPPGMKSYVDVLAALVPTEVLTLHGLMLSVTTKVDKVGTKITDPGALFWALLGLLVVSAGLYAIPRVLAKKWDNFDWCRIVIPPLALIGWMILQRSTGFDAAVQGRNLDVSD